MGSPSYGYLRAASCRVGEPLKILTSPTHEGYEWMLAQTGHEFYGVPTPVLKPWNETFRTRPANYFVTKRANEVPAFWDYDLVLIHSRGQYRALGAYAEYHNLPLIVTEHTLPDHDVSREEHIPLLNRRLTTPVFVSDFNVKLWNFPADKATMIPQGVDQRTFCPGDSERKSQLLSVVNLWKQRDKACGYYLWEKVTKGLPTKVLGENPGLSFPAKDLTELVAAYQGSTVFLNTSKWSSSPLTLFEAMACGCAIVSTCTTSIPSVIKHGENGLLSNSPDDLRRFCQELLADPERARELGAAARQTILDRYSIERFTSDWNNLFERVMETT